MTLSLCRTAATALRIANGRATGRHMRSLETLSQTVPKIRSSDSFACRQLVRSYASQGQSNSAGGGSDYQPQIGQAQPQPSTQQIGSEEDGGSSSGSKFKNTAYSMFHNAATTFASLAVLGLAGYCYHKYYKYLVLQKMDIAFRPGDPVLDLVATGKKDLPEADDDPEHWVPRDEQKKIDQIVSGESKGHYYLIVGEKGTGKSSMLLEAMRKTDGDGASIFEAHADLEIFRVRLGKALDFQFFEDYIGSLFSIRGPRDTTALLDIERAFDKLERVALRRRKTNSKPLVLIVNSMHLLRDDEDGKDLLELIQQRAEQWAAAGLVTFVLNSDEYWVYERLKQYATRLEVITVSDLPKRSALQALRTYRRRYHGEEPDQKILEAVFDSVGGRLTFLNQIAKSHDMLTKCRDIQEREKTWFLNSCWILGSEMDDDVMDQQKYASAAMVLAKALVDMDIELNGPDSLTAERTIPEIPLHKAREIMTRADFIKHYEHMNFFKIDSRAMVKADSVPMLNAFREICSQPGFDEHLEGTLQRIADIESLGRTRELVAKDLVQGGKYKLLPSGKGEYTLDLKQDQK